MKNFAKKVSIFVADAASSEQGSGREAGRALFPNLLTIQRDRSHAATRVFKRPWEADSEISGLLQTFVFDKTCICRKIENSPVLQGVFARYVQQQGGNVASSRKSLQAAKHRFASYSQPLGRLILHWDAVLSTLIWVSANRDGDEAKQATDFLAELSEERLVLLSMAADLADECICFVRLYDRESYDVSETAFEVSAFLSRLHHLVNEGGILQQGFTLHMLRQLDKQTAFMAKGVPKVLGGPRRVSSEMLLQMVQRLQVFVALAVDTVKAEFPGHDIVMAFNAFDVSKAHTNRRMASRENHQENAKTSLERIANVLLLPAQTLHDQYLDILPIALHEAATSGRSPFESWRNAVLRARKGKGSGHPTDVLGQALAYYGAWNGLTTSGVEQGFSKIERLIPKDRRLMAEATKDTELRLLFHAEDPDALCKQAVQVWLQNFGAPRSSALDRIDKGVPRKRPVDDDEEADGKNEIGQKRRSVVGKRAALVSADEVQHAAQQGSEGLWDASLLAEQSFQQSKQYKCRVQSLLEGALLEGEIDDDLLEVTQAFQANVAKNNRDRVTKERQRASLIRPAMVKNLQTSTFWLENAELAKLDCANPALVRARPEEADNFIVLNPANPPEAVLWTAALQGGYVANDMYFMTGGAQGIAFDFFPATAVKRSVFISHCFVREEPDLARILRCACGRVLSRWALLTSVEDFVHMTTRAAGPQVKNPKRYAVIAVMSEQGLKPVAGLVVAAIMAPKKAKAKAKAAAAAADVVLVHGPAVPPPQDNLNMEYHHELEQAVQEILACPTFADLPSADPVGISGTASAEDAGWKATFSAEAYQAAMQTAGVYEAAGNIFWLNLRGSATPGVPINATAVKNLQRSHFKGPAHFDGSVAVAVPKNLALSFGNLRRVSPEEPEHAMLFAVRDAIRAGEAEKTLRSWRSKLLSVTIRFEIIETEQDMFFRAVNLRNKVIEEYEALVRTAVGRVFELVAFRSSMQASGVSGAEELFKAWEANVRQTRSHLAETVTLNFVETAFKVYDNLLGDKKLRASVMRIEERYGKMSPWVWMTNLDAVVLKSKTPQLIEWVLLMVEHLLLTEQMSCKDFTKRTLIPQKQKGLLDLWVFKNDLMRYMVNNLLPKIELTAAQREVLASLTVAEELRSKNKNKQWQGTLPESARLWVTFLTNVVFGVGSDGCLKTTLKATSDINEFIANNTAVAEAFSEVEEKARAEQGRPEQASGGSSAEVQTQALCGVGGMEVSLTELITPEQANQDDGQLEAWFEFMNTKIDQFCKFIVDRGAASMTNSALAAELKENSVLAEINGPALLLYDSKTAGEASSNANVRLPPFRAQHLKRMAQAFIKARDQGGDDIDQQEELRDGDIIMVLDGGRHGNDGSIQGSFTKISGESITKVKQAFTVVYDEESVGERRERVRGFVTCTESLYAFTRTGLAMERRPRKHFPGTTTMGSVIGPIQSLAWTDENCWKEQPKVKKDIFTKEHKVLVGGAVEATAAQATKPSFPDDSEPVFWHYSPPVLFSELLHSFRPMVVVRGNETDHCMAMECIKAKIPLVSICLSETHKEALTAQVKRRLWKAMQTESVPEVYEPTLAKLLSESSSDGTSKNQKKTKPEAKKRAKKAEEGEDDKEAKTEETGGEPEPKKPKKGGRPTSSANASAAETARQALLAKLMGKSSE
ncbi:unnamed protein product [Effrenium voratum]|nr:unnamed protein product [Effrenium voratum]